MPTYVYETIPQKKGQKPKRFEVSQSMKDEPLKKHPKTGTPVRRVIAGGIGVITKHAAPPRHKGCCGSHGDGSCENCCHAR